MCVAVVGLHMMEKDEKAESILWRSSVSFTSVRLGPIQSHFRLSEMKMMEWQHLSWAYPIMELLLRFLRNLSSCKFHFAFTSIVLSPTTYFRLEPCHGVLDEIYSVVLLSFPFWILRINKYFTESGNRKQKGWVGQLLRLVGKIESIVWFSRPLACRSSLWLKKFVEFES